MYSFENFVEFKNVDVYEKPASENILSKRYFIFTHGRNASLKLFRNMFEMFPSKSPIQLTIGYLKTSVVVPSNN